MVGELYIISLLFGLHCVLYLIMVYSQNAATASLGRQYIKLDSCFFRYFSTVSSKSGSEDTFTGNF